MSKYIDVDKLKKSIGNYAEGAHAALNPIDGDADYYKGKIDACKDIQDLIDSLQQEQPSLPSNIDEAAEETAQKYYCSCLEKHNETGICDGCENIKLSFKAGVEWMAWQGYKQTERVYNFNGENIPCVSPVIYLPKEFEIGDKVVVQVRKK